MSFSEDDCTIFVVVTPVVQMTSDNEISALRRNPTT